MIVTIVLALCVFASWLLIPHKITRYILGTLATLALLLQVIAITANMTHHWGMEKQVTTSDKKEIYSAGDQKLPTNLLIANEIGEDTDNYVMVFKNNEDDKKAKPHFKPNMDKSHMSEAVKKQAKYEVKDTDQATQQTTKEEWVWKSDFYKFLLNFGDDQQELIQSTTTVTVPDDTWVVLNADQAKKLQQSQKDAQQQMDPKKQQQMAQQLAMKYKKQHRDASEQQVKDYVEHQTQIQVTKQIKQMISDQD